MLFEGLICSKFFKFFRLSFVFPLKKSTFASQFKIKHVNF